jgi:hypothetical protein
MKIQNTLPTIDGPTMMELSRSGVLAEANEVRKTIQRAVGELNPAGVVSLALSLNPDEPPASALAKVKASIGEALTALAAAGTTSGDAHRAEHQRFAGTVEAAAHRTLEIAGKLASIKARIRSGEHSQNGKRDRLRAAGLDGEELDRAAVPFDATVLNAEHAKLVEEQNALETFLRSRDPRHLPEGFEVSP